VNFKRKRDIVRVGAVVSGETFIINHIPYLKTDVLWTDNQQSALIINCINLKGGSPMTFNNDVLVELSPMTLVED